MVKNLQLVSRVEVVHSSECQIDSFFFTIDISGQTVQPVFLCSPFHYQQRSRKQWESNKIGRSIFSSKFKHSYSSKRHYCNISKKIQALKSKKNKFIYPNLNFTLKMIDSTPENYCQFKPKDQKSINFYYVLKTLTTVTVK